MAVDPDDECSLSVGEGTTGLGWSRAPDSVSGAIVVFLARAAGNVGGFGDEDEEDLDASFPAFVWLSKEIDTSLLWTAASASLFDLTGHCHYAGGTGHYGNPVRTSPAVLETNYLKLLLIHGGKKKGFTGTDERVKRRNSTIAGGNYT